MRGSDQLDYFASTVAFHATEKQRANYLSSGDRENGQVYWKEPPLNRRQKLERQVSNLQVKRWLAKHTMAQMQRVDVTPERRRALRECFDILDIDGGGTIGPTELSLAMKALGFTPSAVKSAMAVADQDGDGEMDFEEFSAFITNPGNSGASGDAAKTPEMGDTFPFTLMINTIRITRLVDSYNPALKDKEKTPASEKRMYQPQQPMPSPKLKRIVSTVAMNNSALIRNRVNGVKLSPIADQVHAHANGKQQLTSGLPEPGGSPRPLVPKKPPHRLGAHSRPAGRAARFTGVAPAS